MFTKFKTARTPNFQRAYKTTSSHSNIHRFFNSLEKVDEDYTLRLKNGGEASSHQISATIMKLLKLKEKDVFAFLEFVQECHSPSPELSSRAEFHAENLNLINFGIIRYYVRDIVVSAVEINSLEVYSPLMGSNMTLKE